MNVVCDAPGSERSHGYTDAGEHVWYWVYDHAEEEVSFRETGYPVEHPIKRAGEVPDAVRTATEEWLDGHVTEAGRVI